MSLISRIRPQIRVGVNWGRFSLSFWDLAVYCVETSDSMHPRIAKYINPEQHSNGSEFLVVIKGSRSERLDSNRAMNYTDAKTGTVQNFFEFAVPGG